MKLSSITSEVGRAVPLAIAAGYLNFISKYGTAIVTTLAIAYGILQLILRWIEHRKIMKARTVQEEVDVASK